MFAEPTEQKKKKTTKSTCCLSKLEEQNSENTLFNDAYVLNRSSDIAKKTDKQSNLSFIIFYTTFSGFCTPV